ncbi:hypothetical protein D3C86_2171060 [compost metagenome]
MSRAAMLTSVAARSGEQVPAAAISGVCLPSSVTTKACSSTVTGSTVSFTIEKVISLPSVDGVAATATGWKKRRTM